MADLHDLHGDLRSLAFPTLSPEQVEELARCTGASRRQVRDGETLFEAGDRDAKFFVVRSGEIEIVDSSGDEAKTLVVHGPGGFTGEVAQLTGAPALVSARARGDGEVCELPAEVLREVVSQCVEVGDVILQAFLARRQLLQSSGEFVGLRVIGSRFSKDTFRIRDFLARNRVPFTWLDLESDEATAKLLQQFGVGKEETPVVACGKKLMLRNPTNRELADAIGIHRPLRETTYDLVIVGAGPAGLAAAVYGASEGLRTVVLERSGPGGQAGRSMRIENYLGFPTGITGGELTDRAVAQATKFGAVLTIPTPVVELGFDNRYAMLRIDGGESFVAKCMLIATGAEYRRLTAEGCERFEGSGVYYAATPNEAKSCEGEDVVVVGGGNSAGQGAVYLAGICRKVLVVVRGNDLYEGMSSYLAQRLENTENVEVLLHTEVRRMHGDAQLAAVELVDKVTGETRTVETEALFCFIGAVPRTDWLSSQVDVDAHGFVTTGIAARASGRWTERRDPFLLETCRPGVFAAGDVRAGSVKRVASAVGEGAMAVQFVHQYSSGM